MKSYRRYGSVYALLLGLWALLVLGARANSLSMDEPLHIVAGYIFLGRWPDGLWYLAQRLPPPLLNVMEASLFFISRPNIPLEHLAGWNHNFLTYTDAFLPYLQPLDRIAVLARTPMMFLTVLLGALVFRWGKDLAGFKGGWLALAWLTFDPLLLAHGRLANTDSGVTWFGLVTLYATWRWAQRPSWRWTWLIGISLGLTLLAKFSAFLWGGAVGCIVLWTLVRRWQTEGLRCLAQSLVIGISAFLLLWGAFGFTIGQTAQLPFPLPAPLYWDAFLTQQSTAADRIFIAFDQLWQGPHWWYFPLNFLIKNPLPFLIASGSGGYFFIKLARRRFDYALLLVFPVLYTLASMSGGMNVSYRHLLPVHPFLYLIGATGMVHGLRSYLSRWPVKLAAVLLGCWYVGGTLVIFPDELAYFNELVGGPEGGYRYLVDYTQDWGQAYKALKSYVAAHPGPEPQVFYFTNVRADHYSLTTRILEQVTPFHPQPGRYVLGPAPLYGLVGANPQQFNWFRHHPPTAMIAHSLFVYDVISQPTWLAQCLTPTVPLSAAAITAGFGSTSLRLLEFDCTSSWIYPGNSTLGSYALHHTLLANQRCGWGNSLYCDPIPLDPFIKRRLVQTRLAYEQRQFAWLPAFALYESGSPPVTTTSKPPPLYPAPATTIPLALSTSQPLSQPVALAGPLTLLTVAVHPTAATLEVETWWTVTSGPITRPLSIMAHLLTADGTMLGTADGLGSSPLIWQAGDLLIQRHRFLLPATGNVFWLRTGAYWLDTMQRWSVAGHTEADALFIPLHELP